MFDKGKFVQDINSHGYSIVENVLSPEFIVKAKRELEIALGKEEEYHKTKEYSDYGMVLLCSLYGGAFIELFDNEKLNSAFNSILGNGCIVYAYTSSSMPPNKTNYSKRIHVDCPRCIPGYITNMGATILLDDFTEENGATWFLPGSQNLIETPSEEYFYKNAKRLIAKAGSVWFFNARIWHAGGNNNTDKWRHALTINMGRAYMKQRIDIPRAMEHMDLSNISQTALQKLGFFAQVPASYDEYYVAPEKENLNNLPNKAMDENYKKTIEANIALHSRMANDYNTCEPHFRPENVSKVEAKLKEVFSKTRAEKMLDLGCGTGFLINIGKKYLKEIHGVDVTQSMMDRVDKSGDCIIKLFNHDTGTFPVEDGTYDVVTGYSFLHHLYDISPTVTTAFKALKKGGIFYADLDPNFYFWESIHALDRFGSYDEIIKREIEMVTYKDEDIEKNFGVNKDIFNAAEYGKNIKGGFKEEEIIALLKSVGFKEVNVFYHWFVGQGKLINDNAFSKEERFKYAEIMDAYLQKALPVSKNLFKYIGFTALK